MINYNSKEGYLEITGTLVELAAETSSFIHQMYESIKQKDPIVAEHYKDMIKSVFEKDLIFISSDELHEASEIAKENTAKMLDSFDELMKGLRDTINKMDQREKDIRSADFDDNDKFLKFFHGEDKEE